MTNQPVAIIFKASSGKWVFKSLSKAGTDQQHYRISNGCWASKSYAAKVARESGFLVEYE